MLRPKIFILTAGKVSKFRHPKGYSRALYQYRLSFPPLSLSSNRSFSTSNEKLRETLENIRNKAHQGSDDSKTDSSNQSKEESGDNTKFDKEPFSKAFINEYSARIYDWIRNSYDIVVDQITLAYSEMIGESRKNPLERRVEQAESFRKPNKTTVEDDSVEADGVETGNSSAGSAIVLVKEPTDPWAQMKERLSNSPLIQEILRRTKKIGNAAAQTEVGKTAQKIGENVKHKMEDIREFWETSQNPIVYSVSGIIESLTSETEEGLAVKEIMKLDPGFQKVQRLYWPSFFL